MSGREDDQTQNTATFGVAAIDMRERVSEGRARMMSIISLRARECAERRHASSCRVVVRTPLSGWDGLVILILLLQTLDSGFRIVDWRVDCVEGGHDDGSRLCRLQRDRERSPLQVASQGHAQKIQQLVRLSSNQSGPGPRPGTGKPPGVSTFCTLTVCIVQFVPPCLRYAAACVPCNTCCCTTA